MDSLYAATLAVLIHRYGWQKGLLMLVATVAAVTIADQVCATHIRPAVERLRPANMENPISALVHRKRIQGWALRIPFMPCRQHIRLRHNNITGPSHAQAHHHTLSMGYRQLLLTHIPWRTLSWRPACRSCDRDISRTAVLYGMEMGVQTLRTPQFNTYT